MRLGEIGREALRAKWNSAGERRLEMPIGRMPHIGNILQLLVFQLSPSIFLNVGTQKHRDIVMRVNSDKPDSWKSDIAKSVDYYNKWFMRV